MDISLFPIWTGKVAICIGGGASLTQEQVDKTKGYKVIAINDAYKLAPHADILYACDRKWWDLHRGAEDFKGYKLQHEFDVRPDDSSILKPYPGIDMILSSGEYGWDDRDDRIRTGGNSGYQALQIAIKLGATTIGLLGYDMHAEGENSHWFGEHPGGDGDPAKYNKWIERFPDIKKAADEKGVKIYNCTPNSALDCFPRCDIEDLGLINNKESE